MQLRSSSLFATLCCLMICTEAINKEGVAILQNNGTNTVQGTVIFRQVDDSDMSVIINITNMEPNTQHGFHVHQFGDTSDFHSSPPSTGFHFFPYCPPDNCTEDQQHGLPPSSTRHAGDMGNIMVDGAGRVQTTLTIGQGKMSLSDNLRSIIGRAIVIHDEPDDGQQPYGNAGNVVAAGVIGISASADTNSSRPSIPITSMLCILHDTAEIGTSPDVNARGYFEIDQFDIRQVPVIKAKVHNISAQEDMRIDIYSTGDLTNLPSSLGPLLPSNVINSVLLDKTHTCGTTRFHHANVTTVAVMDFTQFVGRSCALLINNQLAAAGVIGLPNPDDTDTIFTDSFFSTHSCNSSSPSPSPSASHSSAASKHENDDGLSTGAIVGIVVAVAVVVFGMGTFLIWYRTASLDDEIQRRSQIGGEYVQAEGVPPVPAGPPPVVSEEGKGGV